MTQRENYLSIIARKGFESIPSYINWCPHLEETCRDKLDRMAAEGRCVLAPLHYTGAIPARPQDSSVFLPYLPD